MSSELREVWENAGGKAPSHWQFVKFEDLLVSPKSIAVGVMYPGSHVESGVPLIKVSNVRNGAVISKPNFRISDEVNHEYRRTSLCGDELLITLVGNPGDCAIVDETMAGWNAARALAVVRLQDPSIRYWLRYILLTDAAKHLIGARLNTTVQKTLNLKDIRSLPVPLAPKDERREIVKVAAALEKKVIVNNQTNQTLEQIAQAIFKSWFVDFEPVKAKISALEAGGSEEDTLLAAMQAISGKDKAQLTRLQTDNPEHYHQLRTTAELFPSAMQDSELGEIPEGWEATPFEELLEKTIGGDWGKEDPDEKHTEEVKILRGTDLPNVYSGNDDKVPTRYVEAKKLKSRQLKPWDIVIEVSGGSKGQPTGRSLLITDRLLERLGRSEPASFCRMFRPINENVSLLLALHLQKIYADGKTWLYQNQSTGISNFQTKTFLSKEIVTVPPSPVQEAFFKMVNPLIERIYANESTLLGALRDALLPKLLSGEINIAEESNNQSTDEFNKES